MMEGAYTVADGMTTSAHPTLFPHQVSELSQNEQIERLKTALFDCSKRMFSEPITLAGKLAFDFWGNIQLKRCKFKAHNPNPLLIYI